MTKISNYLLGIVFTVQLKLQNHEISTIWLTRSQEKKDALFLHFGCQGGIKYFTSWEPNLLGQYFGQDRGIYELAGTL